MKATTAEIQRFLQLLAEKRHPHLNFGRVSIIYNRRISSHYKVHNGGRVVTLTFGDSPLHKRFLETFDRAMHGVGDMLSGQTHAITIEGSTSDEDNG